MENKAALSDNVLASIGGPLLAAFVTCGIGLVLWYGFSWADAFATVAAGANTLALALKFAVWCCGLLLSAYMALTFLVLSIRNFWGWLES